MYQNKVVLGDCVLYLGDCLAVMKDMPDKSVDAVITDPPYGINYQSARRTDANQRFDVLEGDGGVPVEWLSESFRVAKDTACLFCFCRWDTQQTFYEAISKAGWIIKSQVIWDRGVHGLGDLKVQYAPMHDNVWFAIKGCYQFSGKRPKSVLRVDRLPASDLIHPTQKPSSLMKIIIGDLTTKEQSVLDPFMGSGTTGVACIQTGRNFIGIEIDAGYFKIAEKRIHDAQQQMRLPI
jgi:site-specific DNA-methyltransferase (adenine-specific)